MEKKNLKREIPLALLSAPSLVFGLLCLIVAALCGLATDIRPSVNGFWTLDATWRPWFAKRWKYSTTLGLTVFYHPGHLADPEVTTRLKRHEAVHVRQHQDHGILGILLGTVLLFIDPKAAFVVWILSPAYSLCGFLGAFLRGGDPYRDAEHERSAYGQVASGWDRPWKE